jgi:hypothetical protein
VFHGVDFIVITIKLMQKDYLYLAKCMVPLGDQIKMTLDERVMLLKKYTQRFSEEEIDRLFKKTV